jgi:F-type H+-transporting ATPase subunit b
MPQFDFHHVFWPQVAWLAVFFAVLYFGVVQRTLPRLGRTMTAREDQVNGDIATAEAAKAESDRISADYEAGVAAAQDSARGKLVEAQAKATAALEKKLAASNEVLGAQAAAAQASLDAARGKALGEIEAVASSAAADIVEKLIGKRPAAGVADNAARTALG